MDVLLTQDSDYLWKIAQNCQVSLESLIKANSHLDNFQTVDLGEILIIPSNLKPKGVNNYYQIEQREVQHLISYSKFLKAQTDAITWTVVISGGSVVVSLAGSAAVAGVTIIVGAATAVGLMYLTRNTNSTLRLNSATNVGVPAPSTPNASISNTNTNSSTGIRTLMTEMAHAVTKIKAQTGRALEHIGYLQNGKGPDCLPGSQCWEDNKEHWKTEIRAFLKNSEKYLKRVKGNTQEILKKLIEELRKEADKF